MAKLLKPMIILLLVLSLVALGLGFQLFSQRENLKGRVTKLENATQQVARNIQYKELSPQMLKDYASMDGQLAGVSKAAQNQFEELQTTQADLQSTRDDLAATQGTLERTRTELADAQRQVESLQDESQRQRSEIAQKSRNLDSLEQAKSALEEQVGKLTDDLASAEGQLRDRIREYDDLLKEYTQLVRNIDPSSAGISLDPSIEGRVLVTRPEWNFVIVDLGNNVGIESQAELLVHRDRDLVGRIRITEVHDTLSIGEILSDWNIMPVTSGDVVIPPGS